MFIIIKIFKYIAYFLYLKRTLLFKLTTGVSRALENTLWPLYQAATLVAILKMV